MLVQRPNYGNYELDTVEKNLFCARPDELVCPYAIISMIGEEGRIKKTIEDDNIGSYKEKCLFDKQFPSQFQF